MRRRHDVTHSRPPAAVVSASLPPACPSRACRCGPAAHRPVRLSPGWRPCPRPTAKAGSLGARPERMRGAPAVSPCSLRARGACAGPAGGTLTGPLTLPAHAHGLPAAGCRRDRSRASRLPLPLMGPGSSSRPGGATERCWALLLLTRESSLSLSPTARRRLLRRT